MREDGNSIPITFVVHRGIIQESNSAVGESILHFKRRYIDTLGITSEAGYDLRLGCGQVWFPESDAG
jgi:hypothetical protein